MNQRVLRLWLPAVLSAVLFGGLFVVGAGSANAATAVVASVLPASRSVQIDTPATLFATIVNAGAETGVSCRIEIDPALGVNLSYQTTNPATNALVGSRNTPVDVPVGGLQTFVITLSSATVFEAATIVPQFLCDNAEAAAEFPGVNTFSFAAAAEPVADIIALGATLSNDGVVILADAASSNVFSVATINVGASSSIIANADFGLADLPAVVSICQTDPLTSLCINPTTPTTGPIELSIEPFETPTFGVFVTAQGNIPFDAANNRAFVRFSDSNGALRGGTSVALRLRGPSDPLLLTQSNASAALTPGLELQSELFNLSATALRELRNAMSSEPFSTANTCFRSGGYEIAARDENGDGRLRAGDSLTITYDNCSSRLDGVTAYTGAVSLNLVDAVVSSRGDARFTLDLTTVGLQLNSPSSGQALLDASYRIVYTRSESLESFEVPFAPDNFLSVRSDDDNRHLSGISWSKILRPGVNNDYELDFSGVVRSSALNGTVNCAANELIGSPLAGTFVAPALGEYRCTSAAGVSVVLDNLGQVVLNSGAGVELIAGAPGWRDRAPEALFSSALLSREWPSFASFADTPVIADLSLEVVDLVASDATGLVYASTEQGVLGFDPSSGIQVVTYSMPAAAGALAVSDDGLVLYVGYAELAQMQTLDLATGEFGPLQSLGAAPGPAQDPPQTIVPATLAFVPGSRTDVVVGFRANLRSFQHLGLALFRDGVRAPNIGPADAQAIQVVFHNNRLFGSGDSRLTEFNLDESGITAGTTLANFTLGSTFPLRSQGNRLVSDLGRVFDFDSMLLEGTYEAVDREFTRRVLSFGINNERVYSVGSEEMVVYDAQRYTPLAIYETPFSRIDLVNRVATISNFMAVASESQLVFFDHRDLVDRPAPECQTIDLNLFFEQTNSIQIQCQFSDFVHDEARDRIYASATARNGVSGNSIAVIDASTGNIEQFIPVGPDPVKLSLALDTQTLLIGYQQRNTLAYLDLDSFALTESLPLTNTLSDGVKQLTLPLNILAAPTGAQDAFVNLGQDLLNDSRLVLLTEAGIAANSVAQDAPTEFVLADNGRLYGVARGLLTEFDVGANGLTAIRIASGQIFAGNLVRDGNRLYSRSGYRFNVDSFSGSRAFLVPGGAVAVAADPVTNAVVFQQNRSGTLNLYRSDDASLSFDRLYRPPLLGQFYSFSSSDSLSKITAQLPERYVVLGNNALLFIPKSEVTR